MTLIGFATYGDRAEFITDSMHYTKRLEVLGRTFKHVALPHLSAAILCSGDGLFSTHAKSGAMQASAWCATFDDLLEEFPQMLGEFWADRLAECPEATEVAVYALGWSDREGKFIAVMFACEQGFKPVLMSKPFLSPATYMNRPSGMELRRLRAAEWDDEPRYKAAIENWSYKPPLPAPGSVQGWVDLAMTSRLHRSLSGAWARVIVAGDLFHTVLTRDAVSTTRVHEFNDQGDEFLTMIEGTQHPTALAADCWCGSSNPSGECCNALS